MIRAALAVLLATTTTVGCGGRDSPSTDPSTGGVSMEVSSPAFEAGGPIPARFTCDGADVSPELRLVGMPEGTDSLVLIMDDPDAPVGTWDHWVAFDLEPAGAIAEDVGALGTGGLNSWRRTGYGGPCPPAGTHRYFFRILALDGRLGLAEGATKDEVVNAAEGHVLAEAILMGTYSA
jgi:Raf kinase inhibitor-like YbhB/YbcL family protein